MVSVIIPALDEERGLPRCLASLEPHLGAGEIEAIVVDGGSSDGTVERARECAGVTVLASSPGRAVQMNAGAAAARGSLLVFLHADTHLGTGALPALIEADRRGTPSAGGLRHRFDRNRWSLRWISWISRLRGRWTGLLYGDQVPFVRRELFDELGGFREEAPMEDADFSARLLRRVRPRVLPYDAITSSRRFDRAGDLRAGLESARLLLVWLLFRRVPSSDIFFSQVR